MGWDWIGQVGGYGSYLLDCYNYWSTCGPFKPKRLLNMGSIIVLASERKIMWWFIWDRQIEIITKKFFAHYKRDLSLLCALFINWTLIGRMKYHQRWRSGSFAKWLWWRRSRTRWWRISWTRWWAKSWSRWWAPQLDLERFSPVAFLALHDQSVARSLPVSYTTPPTCQPPLFTSCHSIYHLSIAATRSFRVNDVFVCLCSNIDLLLDNLQRC